MNDDDDNAREKMQRRLGAALAAGGSAPHDIVERAVELLRWRRDGTVAFIVDDDDLAVAAVRGTAPPSASREFTDGTVLISLATEAGRVVGDVAPWNGGRVVLEVDGDEVEASVDDRGRFQVDHASGTVGRIRVEPDGSAPIWTTVIRLSSRRRST